MTTINHRITKSSIDAGLPFPQPQQAKIENVSENSDSSDIIDLLREKRTTKSPNAHNFDKELSKYIMKNIIKMTEEHHKRMSKLYKK